jgi:uncharacterized protein
MAMPQKPNDRVGIAVFAKAPVAGFAKTRLMPRLGAQGAADFQRELIERSVLIALAARTGPVSLWCTPSCDHEAFASLAAIHPIELHQQSGADLGARMLAAFEILTRDRPTLVIGTDCVVLQERHLVRCAEAMQAGVDVVFLPSEDGGYALVGAARPWPELFSNIEWSTVRVMETTRARVRQLGLRELEPEILWDVDTPADYDRAIAAGLIRNAVVDQPIGANQASVPE